MTNEEIVNNIVLGAMRKNRSLGITGVLWFDDRSFVQVLEGDADQVSSLYSEIERDGRHTDVTLLSARQAERRNFPRFSMKHVRSTSRDEIFELAQVGDPEDRRRSEERFANIEFKVVPSTNRGALIQRAIRLLMQLAREPDQRQMI